MSNNNDHGHPHQPGPYDQAGPSGYPPQVPPHAPSDSRAGGFGQPGYGQQDPYSGPQHFGQQTPGPYPYPPQTKSNSKVWIIVSIIAVLVLAIGIALFYVLGGDDEDEQNDAENQEVSNIGGDDTGLGVDVETPDIGGSLPEGGESVSRGGGDGPEQVTGQQSDNRPSYDEVIVGVQSIFESEFERQGVTEQDLELLGLDIDMYYTCLADAVYEELPVETLEVIAIGDPNALVDDTDYAVMDAAAEDCLVVQLG